MAGSDSQEVVFDYLRYKLQQRGVAWEPPQQPIGTQRRRSDASLPWRPDGLRAWHRGGEEEESQPAPGPPPPPPRLQAVLRSAGDELERCYRDNLTAHAVALLRQDGGSARRRLTAVRDELLRDGVNWGRIVALMELSAATSAEVASREGGAEGGAAGGAGQVDDIARWMADSLDSPPLQGWIEENGGWDAFVELYGESRPPVSFWCPTTVFGLAVLGAAGITLGAFFTQK
ncbi:apoptosis regulator Bcl-2-like [Scomber japonicus]|uniref:apoptosis regulator Bcl-2-like n=1 Tax=Scomber japonicus TaxID=13676 RepID=UPI002306B095|nr:apoptosis regulator Bcl-2-like [Scomber japonicus]